MIENRPENTLVVATTNRGKFEELRLLLSDLPISLLRVDQATPKPPVVVEDGATFADNARKKARAVAGATMMLTLADDSGLEVDALNGRPGVRSARFAHERASDSENNAALLGALDEMGDLASGPETSRRGRFRCVLALIDPFDDESFRESGRLVEGVCEGFITSAPRGSGGFGYDPLFVVEELGRTMAELSEEEKSRVSHRGKAMRALRPVLEEILQRRAEIVARVDA